MEQKNDEKQAKAEITWVGFALGVVLYFVALPLVILDAGLWLLDTLTELTVLPDLGFAPGTLMPWLILLLAVILVCKSLGLTHKS